MPQDARWNAKIQASLSVVDRVAGRFDGGFAPESRAAKDAAQRNGSLAWSFAVGAEQTALDHLRAWRHMHATGMQPPFAHWTLLRASVEGSALARWVCADVDACIARGIGAQLEDFEQRSRFESRLAVVMPETGLTVAARLRAATLEMEAEEDGVATQPQPGPTDLVAALPPAHVAGAKIDSQILYRLLSAFAHAKMWGMPILGDMVRGDPLPMAPELARTTITAPADLVWLLTDWAARSLELAADMVGDYGQASPQ